MQLPHLVSCFVVFGLTACSSSESAPSGGASGVDAGAGASSALSADGTPPACTGATGGGALPAPRGDVGGALDPTGRRFVIFGGDVTVPICGQSPTPKFDAETWVLDVACGVWRSVPSGAATPSARARHAMATDAARGRAILFGGRTRQGGTAYTLFDDVWAFDFAAESWSKLEVSGKGPAPRANAAMAIDGDRLVVFGGNTSTNGLNFTPNNDAFVLDLTTLVWSALGSGPKPPARLFHAMAIDEAAKVAYVYGGGDEQAFTGPFLRDTWALDLESGAWRELKTTGDAPVPRINHGAMFDKTDGALVVFGGHDDGKLGNQNDVYRLDVASARWSRVAGGDTYKNPSTGQCDFPSDFTAIDKAVPERRSAFAFGPRADGRGFLAAFGKSDCGVVADAWWWSSGPSAWKALRENPVGLSCERVSTTCKSLCN